MRDLTLARRQQLLRLTASSGVAANLEVALDAVGLVLDPELQSQLHSIAAAGGHAGWLQLPVLVWAVEELGASAEDADLLEVVQRCDLEVLEWLKAIRCPLDGTEVALRGAELGRLPVVKLAVYSLQAWARNVLLMNKAARSGSVELMSWLRESRCKWDGWTFACAACAGCEATLEFVQVRPAVRYRSYCNRRSRHVS
ncbi:hypothetical protein GPECTOR_8g166 [Gonium pectorale]|uniref:Uncharacterized protein n=1 Tax=Gonium pectorale TaxID=33097 RepID=A0A150GSE9_GONPE|nr:hypothetical protein GPECTOR_8g166 [Gonium pectorale]|eukprot:KXZ52777.1 hypothetical protein GPECTOR_8g166 [Gonium pectorale]